MKRGIVLDQWARGLSVMLEKMFGCALITKLWSILLMEADFNTMNKMIYGQRMLDTAHHYKLIPEEIYSELNCLADDGTLAKVLFYDIVQQTRLPAGISAVDADNCYNWIAHPIASMVFQALGVSKPAIVLMLSTIQDMKFFLQTGYGDSKDYAGSTGEVKTQGLCQGNGAAPAEWMFTSIAMIQAHKQKGHDVHLYCPISKKEMHLAGTLFVNDTNLEHFDPTKNKTVIMAHEAMQRSILNWGWVLIATGSALKPSKCFYHLVSFLWKPDETWKYDQNEKKPALLITVPLTDESNAPIDHPAVTKPSKMLGSMTCPTGCSDGAITQMVEKAQGWIDRAKLGKLHKWNLWFLLEEQFWPKVSFGISSITAPFEVLDECLMKIYFNILSISGVC
jgi:hypothetical protein